MGVVFQNKKNNDGSVIQLYSRLKITMSVQKMEKKIHEKGEKVVRIIGEDGR